MEQLQYVIEDSTIAELLGVQNFSSDESAVLELVKNAYDANAKKVTLSFCNNVLTIADDGDGMNSEDIRQHWMHVGKSPKAYITANEDGEKRVLSGAKGVGRFALARLGCSIKLTSKKVGSSGVIWETDWNSSALGEFSEVLEKGTTIQINGLREKWGKKKIERLSSFLSKTYNDDRMAIFIDHPDMNCQVTKYFKDPQLGKNYLSLIKLSYNSSNKSLSVRISSDEFSEQAHSYCQGINLHCHNTILDMVDELKSSAEWELSSEELESHLQKLGDFTGEFYFSISPTKTDVEKFLYKHYGLDQLLPGGIILYRNAFSISSYEGKKDWLGFGKRSRKSPAAATHATGSWRVRENQMAGKVIIDKKNNAVLQDLSNRQGLDENVFYELFVEVILAGIKEFERYRQSIIRKIDVKNAPAPSAPTPIVDTILKSPSSLSKLSKEEATQLVSEIKSFKTESSSAKKEKADVEKRYKYDIRILNVLATVGLKAASVAHEVENNRNSISQNTADIIAALEEYGFWEELNSPERTKKSFKNIPYLLESNQAVSEKIIRFMNVMLSEIEKKQFESSWQSVLDILNQIKVNWEDEYASLKVNILNTEDICFNISSDVLQVIFDNLILNSVQQNQFANNLVVNISVQFDGDLLSFSYSDNGKGLDKKYKSNPRRILEVHETTRQNGHGLGMWIINNTITLCNGQIEKITGDNGFAMDFTLGGEINGTD